MRALEMGAYPIAELNDRRDIVGGLSWFRLTGTLKAFHWSNLLV